MRLRPSQNEVGQRQPPGRLAYPDGQVEGQERQTARGYTPDNGHVHIVGEADNNKDEVALQKDLAVACKGLQVEDTHGTRDNKVQFKFDITP